MNPIVKRIALRLCETAPACVLEVLLEALIKTWNGYVREYNLPFTSIALEESQGLAKDLDVSSKLIGTGISYGDSKLMLMQKSSSSITTEQTEETRFFEYFREKAISGFLQNQYQTTSTQQENALIVSKASEKDVIHYEHTDINENNIQNVEDKNMCNETRWSMTTTHQQKGLDWAIFGPNTLNDERNHNKLAIYEENVRDESSLRDIYGPSHIGRSSSQAICRAETLFEEFDNLNKGNACDKGLNYLGDWSTKLGDNLELDDIFYKTPKYDNKMATVEPKHNKIEKLNSEFIELMCSLEHQIRLSRNRGMNHGKEQIQNPVDDMNLKQITTAPEINHKEWNENDFGSDINEKSTENPRFDGNSSNRFKSLESSEDINLPHQIIENGIIELQTKNSDIKEEDNKCDPIDRNSAILSPANELINLERIYYSNDLHSLFQEESCNMELLQLHGATVESIGVDLTSNYVWGKVSASFDSKSSKSIFEDTAFERSESDENSTKHPQSNENLREFNENKKDTMVAKIDNSNINMNFITGSKANLDPKEIKEIFKTLQTSRNQNEFPMCEETNDRIMSHIKHTKLFSSWKFSCVQHRESHHINEPNMKNKTDCKLLEKQKNKTGLKLLKKQKKLFSKINPFGTSGRKLLQNFESADTKRLLGCSDNAGTGNAIIASKQHKEFNELQLQDRKELKSIIKKSTHTSTKNTFEVSSEIKVGEDAENRANYNTEENKDKSAEESLSSEKMDNEMTNKTISKHSIILNDDIARKTRKDCVQVGYKCNKILNPLRNKITKFRKHSDTEKAKSEKITDTTSASRKTTLKKDPYIHYKDRRFRSMLMSVAKSKRKNPRKRERKQVTFAKDDRMLSFHPNESILETFYNGKIPEKQIKQDDKNRDETAVSELILAGKEVNKDKGVVADRITFLDETTFKMEPKIIVTDEKSKCVAENKKRVVKNKSADTDDAKIEEAPYYNLAFVDGSMLKQRVHLEPDDAVQIAESFKDKDPLLPESNPLTGGKLRMQGFKDSSVGRKKNVFKKMKAMLKK